MYYKYVSDERLAKIAAKEEDEFRDQQTIELNKELDRHKTELDQLPEIFRVRIDALHEVNPEKFADCPELTLASLVATRLVRTLPDKFRDISNTYYNEVIFKYGILWDVIKPNAVSKLVYAYRDDVKSGAIDKNGGVKNLAKSKVMTLCHDSEEYGRPCDANGVYFRFNCKKPKTGITTKQIIRSHIRPYKYRHDGKKLVGTYIMHMPNEFDGQPYTSIEFTPIVGTHIETAVDALIQISYDYKTNVWMKFSGVSINVPYKTKSSEIEKIVYKYLDAWRALRVVQGCLFAEEYSD
ncbi:MAG: hypothetical protein J5714_00885 [Alphaproteobacteria bacterium]|nr:hypothetical protein [Alphaproteobacteria bacterium]